MRTYISICLALLSIITLKAQHSFVSELNGKTLASDSIKYPYKVIFGGHLYGSQNEATQPYANFTKAFNVINTEKPAMFISLGDAVRTPDLASYDKFSDLLQRIDAPVFTAMGNHEWQNPIVSQQYLGFPFYILEGPGSAFIILNSEDWENKEQKAFWNQQLKEYINNLAVKNIFILSHKLIWAVGNPVFTDLASLTNSPEAHKGQSMVDLNLLKTHTDKEFFLVSGDLGLNEKLPFFYQKEGNISYVATGLGDLPTDALIEATIYADNVEFKPLYLGTTQTAKLEDYNMTKVAQLSRKNETKLASLQLNNTTANKAFVILLIVFVFAAGLWLLLGKNEI
jgi:Calcineurin-like phosphoesterase